MKPPPDSRADRRRWIALGLSFLALFAALGVRMSFGAYVTGWEQAFGADRSQVSLISSVSLITYGLGLPLIGTLADRFGARSVFTFSSILMGAGLAASSLAQSVWHLIVLYGVVASVGFCGASAVTASVALTKWFPQNQALAMGASSCGIAAGGMILAPLSIYLIQLLGWRMTLRIFGFSCAFLLAAAMWLFFQDAPSSDESGSQKKDHPQPETARSGLVWSVALALALAVPYLICGFTDLGLFSTHFVPLAMGRGISPAVVAWALAINSATNLGGNLIAGHLADRVSITALLSIMYIWRALGLAFLLTANDPASILIFAVVNGAVEASTIAPTAALCVQLYGPQRLGAVYGLLSSMHQFGAAAGAFLIGALYTHTGSYTSGLILSITLLFVGAGVTQAANVGTPVKRRYSE